MELKDYVSKYYTFANLVASPGVPVALILTHSFLESGRGESQLTKKANNFFGVKALPGEAYISLPTTEIIKGKPVKIIDKFKVYNSPIDSFKDYVRLLNIPRYSTVLTASTVPLKFAQLGKSGYFTAGTSYIKTASTIANQVESILKGLPGAPAAALPILLLTGALVYFVSKNK
jgi:flagellum-specific peptidoglycan hydrolase FlgJ